MTFTPTITVVTGEDRAARFDAAISRYERPSMFAEWAGQAVVPDGDAVRAAMRKDLAFLATADVADAETADLLAQAAHTSSAVLISMPGSFDEAVAAFTGLCSTPAVEQVRFVPLSDDNVHQYPQAD